MSKKCGTESEMDQIIDLLNKAGGNPIEILAEDIIFLDYCRLEVIPPLAIFPSVSPDGTSCNKDHPPDNVGDFINFLKRNNPRADVVSLQLIRNQLDGGVNVPDWITDRASNSTFEYYEVKPASRSGIQKGRTKMVRLETLFGTDPAIKHYNAGIHYCRTGEAALMTFSQGIMANELSIQWFKGSVDGLILYKICSEKRLKSPELSPAAQRSMLIASFVLMAIVIILMAPGGLIAPVLA